MVKKIIEDVVSTKRSSPTYLRSTTDSDKEKNKERMETAPLNNEDVFVIKRELQKTMNHIEEVLPKNETKEEKEKEETIETSPIFEKMKQRHEERESFSQEYASDQNGKFAKYLIKGGVVVGVVLVLLMIVWTTVLYSASITIHQKHTKVSLNAQNFQSVANITGGVSFQVMSLSAEDTVKLTPTGEQRVTKKASGQIVVYNNFNDKPQILIKNTRFETADGKIYRISNQITIPGIKKVGGKDTPGSIPVTVFADEAGTEYNIGLVDFTIPGFKGSPRYEKFFARSKTTMTGGASGMVKMISEADKETARVALTKTLNEKLLADAKAQKPKGTVLYPGAMFFTFTDTINDSVQSGEKDVPFTLKGEMQAVLFDGSELSRGIVKTVGELTEGEKIEIDNIESLTFAWKTPRSSVPDKTETLDFLLTGTANAVWEVDVVAFKSKLAGKSDSLYSSISSQFPGIEKTTDKKFSPPWKHSFPMNVEKIYVETIID